MIERYAVYWVNPDPGRGSEIHKTRPAVVVSDNAMNRLLSTVVVCPLASRIHPHWPSRVQVRVGDHDGEIAVDQICSIDKARIGESLGAIPPEKAQELRHVITKMYGLLSVE